MARFQDDGMGNIIVVYDCFICKDAGWVHPLKEDGKPNYSAVIRCQHCQQIYQRDNDSQIDGNRE